MFLNSVLLFYVYPLKLLFFAMFNGGVTMDLHEARILLVIYGTGFAAVSMVFVLLYLHAWKHRELLALNEIERLRTRHTLADNLGMVGVGLTSAVLAVSLPEQ